MANNNSITAMFDSLPWLAKILLQFFFGWIISPAYRILRYLETKNVVTLIAGIVAIPFQIVYPIDLIFEILKWKRLFSD